MTMRDLSRPGDALNADNNASLAALSHRYETSPPYNAIKACNIDTMCELYVAFFPASRPPYPLLIHPAAPLRLSAQNMIVHVVKDAKKAESGTLSEIVTLWTTSSSRSMRFCYTAASNTPQMTAPAECVWTSASRDLMGLTTSRLSKELALGHHHITHTQSHGLKQQQ